MKDLGDVGFSTRAELRGGIVPRMLTGVLASNVVAQQ